MQNLRRLRMPPPESQDDDVRFFLDFLTVKTAKPKISVESKF